MSKINFIKKPYGIVSQMNLSTKQIATTPMDQRINPKFKPINNPITYPPRSQPPPPLQPMEARLEDRYIPIKIPVTVVPELLRENKCYGSRLLQMVNYNHHLENLKYNTSYLRRYNKRLSIVHEHDHQFTNLDEETSQPYTSDIRGDI
jgi:hypothetical protein